MKLSIGKLGRGLLGQIGGLLSGDTNSNRSSVADFGNTNSIRSSIADHPWLSSYPDDIVWSRPIETRPVFAFLDDAAQRFADARCIDFLGKSYSYSEIANLVNRAAKGFRQLGVEKGVRVGLCLPNCPYAVICYYAVLKAGGTIVNYNPLYVERELAQQVEDSETRIMVTLDLQQLYPKIAALLTSTRLRHIVVCQMSDILPPLKGLLFATLKRSELSNIPENVQHIPFRILINNDGVFELPEIDVRNDLAVLQYTGGTTGVPKGAMLTHGNLSANISQLLSWVGELEQGQERFIGVLPLFHVFGMTIVMNLGIATGSELILLPRFDLDQLLKTIDRTKATVLMGVPTIYAAIIAARDLASHDLSSIKYCVSGGAPLPAALRHDFETLTGCVLVEGYGLTECSPVATCNPLGGVNKEDSVGLPLPGTVVEIRDPGDPKRQLPPGEKGEVCIIGPQVVAGYWRRPDETAKTLIDGRLHTGDIGYIGEDGYVFLIDRLKDIILCGGYNVYPRIIEDAIMTHPAVAEVVVIAVPDGYRGETPKAFVKLAAGLSLSEQELKTYLSDRLSPIEMPEFIEFRTELPKTMVGKLSKKELVAEEAAKRIPHVVEPSKQ